MLDGARTPLPVPPPSRPAPGQAGGRGPCGGGGDDDTYRAFLEAKKPSAVSLGFEVDPAEINPALKDFVRAIVQWAAAGGRRGIFSSFGLHKTSTQIELARLARKKTGALPLIIVPLGVRHEFFDEAQARFTGAHGVELRFIRSSTEIDPADLTDGSLQEAGSAERDRENKQRIYLTNYESAREGKIDFGLFGFVSLDEAAILRGFGGTKTFRRFMAQIAGDDRDAGTRLAGVRYRYVATATPDPNEYIELLAYAAFLGMMDVGEAKTRFFKRDSEKADTLSIHPHKEEEFWLWVASWAIFLSKPSDLGFSDHGYVLPEIDLRWHEVASDHSAAGSERDGQARLFRNAAMGVQDAAAEKRDSLPARIAKMMALRAEGDQEARSLAEATGTPMKLPHRIIWHDLEDERRAIEAAVPGIKSIYGAQALEENERLAIAFKHGRIPELATKPIMSGAGCNFQHHCHWAIFLGIGFKFHDFIQAVHRLVRFGQAHRVRLDLITTEAEREVRRKLERRWKQHEDQAARMRALIGKYGLGHAAIETALARSIGVKRNVIEGDGYTCINNDCVEECRAMPADSVDLIVTSIPFSTQYEYTPSYNDFGHTDDDAHFWAQMDFLTPQLLRIVKPGRVAAIHVKDRIVPGGINGLGFQTVSPFSDDCVAHFRRHGFAFLARKTIVTDVVRENNQTYRLGWTEQCKDGTRMGCGLPEYLLLFRKPQTDRSRGYADTPVVKAKKICRNGRWEIDDPRSQEAGSGAAATGNEKTTLTGYSRARWQLDAHGFARSSGDRQLTPQDLIGLPADVIYKLFRKHSLGEPYDFEHHVACGEALEAAGALPPTFMLLPPASWHEDVWTDVTRMRTLNGAQAAAGREMHLCPIQFDIVDRVIEQFTMPGELVMDPFGGLMTVPYRALKLKRRGLGIELNAGYFRDGAAYCEAMAKEVLLPSLFDLLDVEASGEAA